ncbi:hypothetical protein WA026_003219 [Henosepilachna vigintioctopunctata]|uniref:Cyclic nucleotide-binding domain-containing protein n=1 Tax=Henosepilachna vigintioctopunctata TaxID=420089 RepID=A0AAW1TI39_9CUCU
MFTRIDNTSGRVCHNSYRNHMPFFRAGDGYRPVTLPIEQLSCGFLIIIGFVYHNFAIATIFDILGSVYISESKYQELLFHVPDYIRTRNLPKSMKKKMFMYFEYKFRGRFFKEDEILSTLSEHLRCEVVLNSCENILRKIPLLQGMSKNVIGSVIGFLKREIYLPNDVVIKFGDPMTKMYWISYGTFAAYFGDDMTEILHFEDGDHFCDNAITSKPGPCTLSIVALEITEVFTLNRRDIKHCTAFLKEISEKVNKITKDKSALYINLAERMTDKGVQNRVLADLRRGRILERDRWRRKRTGPLHTIRDKKLIP